MKMTLKRANWACLLAFVLIFAACKKEKEEEVVPEPIVGVTVENGDADVTIDQQEKRIDVTFYAYCDLSEVLVSFDLIEGAQMCIPYLKDTVYRDRSREKGATVAARVDGQTVVYTMFATIEYALAGVQVKAEDVDGEVTLYREDRVVRVVFDRPVDPSRVGLCIESAHSILAGLDPANDMGFALALNKLWGVHLNDQNGCRYDQDKSFGVDNLRNAFNQVKVLYENNYGDRGNFECVGLDVKAMRTQPDEDCYRHLINSKRIFELLLDKVKHFDYEFQAACVKEQNFEKLEMYVMELLMGIK